MSIQVRHINKRFGTFQALDDVSLSIPDGELVALLGPSGSGKTTLLRVIAGLEIPDHHENTALFFHQEDIAARPAKDRKVGFVFQHYALFRHLSVFENVAFGLRVKPRQERPNNAHIRSRVMELLSLVQLDGLAQRYPSQLSGGQRQRVALARALAVEPRVLLLDEPFGALDAKVRQELRTWLRRLHDELHVTSVFVTHDQEEALEVADRVVVMNKGKIIQEGTPEEIFHKPVNEFVMNFIGHVNVFHGRASAGHAKVGPLQIACPEANGLQPLAARALVRPHDLRISDKPNGLPCFKAVVLYINAAGPRARINLRAETGCEVQAEIGIEEYYSMNLRNGAEVYVSVRGVKVFLDEPCPSI